MCYTREGVGCARYRKWALTARLQHRRLLSLASRHPPDGPFPPGHRPFQGADVPVYQLQLCVRGTGPQPGVDVLRKAAKPEYKGAAETLKPLVASIWCLCQEKESKLKAWPRIILFHDKISSWTKLLHVRRNNSIELSFQENCPSHICAS